MARAPNVNVNKPTRWEMLKGIFIRATNAQGGYDAAADDNSPALYYSQDPTALTGLVSGSLVWGPSGLYITNDFGVPVLYSGSGGNVWVPDSATVGWGNVVATPDIAMSWDGTRFNVTQATANSEIRWGVDGAGIDQRWYGDTASTFALWDQSRDTLAFSDNAKAGFGTGAGAAYDIEVAWNGSALAVTQLTANSQILWGVSGAGIDQVFYGDTAGYDLTWDQSLNTLLLSDNAILGIGSGAGAGADMTFLWNGSKLLVGQLTANSAIDWGVDGAGIDQNWYGDTASAVMAWDQSADALTFSGAASIRGIRTSSTTAAAITTTTVLTLADSGGVFSVDQGSAYDIDLPSPTSGPGCRYLFYLTGAAANNVTITVAGSAATFVGTIVNDVTSVIPATGSTLTFATGAAALGDSIEVTSISTGLYLVRAVTSAAGGITVS